MQGQTHHHDNRILTLSSLNSDVLEEPLNLLCTTTTEMLTDLKVPCSAGDVNISGNSKLCVLTLRYVSGAHSA